MLQEENIVKVFWRLNVYLNIYIYIDLYIYRIRTGNDRSVVKIGAEMYRSVLTNIKAEKERFLP